MGKIKTRLIKRTADRLMKEDIDFSENFGKNKKLLGREMPSKKVRNQIAGYIARLKRFQKEKEKNIQESIKAISKE
jgi:small subunit ribosomal protein S17e